MIIEGPAMPTDVKKAGNNTSRGNLSGDQRQSVAFRMVATNRTTLSLPADTPYEHWKHVGQQIFLVCDSAAWWIGDWLIFGREKYPDRYRRTIEETSLDYQTLRNYAWIAGRFVVSRRRDTLSFQHHVDVAGLPEDEQDLWLARAESAGWSRNELRRQLRASRARRDRTGGEPPGSEPPGGTLQLSVSPERRERWQSAAQRAQVDLCEWISATLDGAARS
jgi:hypothetical protein